MTTRWIIGLASGSSSNGVDAALLEVEGAGLGLRAKSLHALHQPYGRDLKELLTRGGNGVEIKLLTQVHRLLGETFASAARLVADRASFTLHRVQCIGCLEHTVSHEPEGRFPSTLGLGMAAVVAERTGVTTIHDFRSRDMSAGGQGMPLTSLADYLLFRHAQECRVLLDLGGLARVVYLPANGRIQDIVGFEAGPCNGLLDGLIRQATAGRETFDPGGKYAVQGCCIDALLERWLAHPYLQRRPPKSLARPTFGPDFVAQTLQTAQKMHWNLPDLLCTATHFVAAGITTSLQKLLPPGKAPMRVLLSGGGIRNGLLWHLLEQKLTGMKLETIDQHGAPAGARKPLAVGILAALTLDGVPGNAPSATGAAGARLLGSLTPGSSANWSRCLAWMASLSGPQGEAA